MGLLLIASLSFYGGVFPSSVSLASLWGKSSSQPTRLSAGTQLSMDSHTTHSLPGGRQVEYSIVSPASTDTDGDGVIDTADKDDDNDGILDEIESCGSVGSGTITIEIQLDNWAYETSWTLKDASNTTVLSDSYSNSDRNDFKSSTLNNADGDYTFEILDSYGDGLTSGYFEIKVDGVTVSGGSSSGNGNFTFSSSVAFSVSSSFTCLSGDPSADDDTDGTLNYQDADFCTLNGNGVCSSLDTDGDGIIDQFDTDSDGDGCADVVEGGGSYTVVDLDANDRLDIDNLSSTGVDSDGIPNDVGSSGQAIGDAQSAGTQSADCSVVDTDGDGVADPSDKDDDNDGILDEIESCGSTGGSATITIEIQLDSWAYETSWTLKDASNTTVLSDSYSSSDNNDFKTSTLNNANGDYTFEILDTYGDGLTSGYFEIKVDGVTVSGGSSSGNGNFTYSSSVAFPASSSFGCLSGDPSGDADSDGTLNYQDSDFCTLNGNGVCSSLDTDGDGTIDQFDTDSDGDGCQDAIEGDGSYTSSDLDGNDRLTSTVDSDGIPGGASQGIGSSADAGTLAGCTSTYTDTDGDGISDTTECYIPELSPTPSPDGSQDGNFPTGYWDAEYYKGFFGISGSTYSNSSNDCDSTGAVGTPVFIGEAFFAVNSYTFTDSRSFSNTQSPASSAVAPSGYVGDNWDPSNSNPYYQIIFNRTMDLDGTLDFGGSGFSVDDVMEVFVNGTRQVFTAYCCGASSTPNTSQSVSYSAGDEVQLRYTNLGWVGSYTFNFTQNYGCTVNKDTDNDGVPDGLDLDSDNDGILDTYELCEGSELVVNGDFEDAYAYWTSDFNRGRNNYAGTAGGCGSQGWVAISPCASTHGACSDYYDYNGSTPTGSTLITDSYGTGANVLPTATCNSTAGSCWAESLPDHTSGTGFSLYIDPNDISGQAYWKQSVSVSANTTYRFSAWIMVIEEDPNLEFKINGESLTGGINLDRLTGGSNGTDEWQEVDAIWNSGSISGSVVLELVNLTAGCSGNDIRLDDVSLKEITVCDTDADGDYDFVDDDSDGDGCWDALEGGGSFTAADLDANMVLDYANLSPSGVDVNGVPNAAGSSGQSLGDAQDAGTLGGDCEGFGISSSSLPIELLSFTIIPKKEGTVLIKWETLNEENNDYFTIERSADAQEWEAIEEMKGAGTSTEILKYRTVDKAPLMGTSYYRLKQTDFDGKYSYSQIMDIHIKSSFLSQIRAFPNPTQGLLTLEGSSGELASYHFYDILGNSVDNAVTVVEQGNGYIQLDLSQLTLGIYILETPNHSFKIRKE
ncbi:MAG: T9SS type A sorting domain-containing protein [Bacteroidota bacterium]